jgi:hypothetical protein
MACVQYHCQLIFPRNQSHGSSIIEVDLPGQLRAGTARKIDENAFHPDVAWQR